MGSGEHAGWQDLPGLCQAQEVMVGNMGIWGIRRGFLVALLFAQSLSLATNNTIWVGLWQRDHS